MSWLQYVGGVILVIALSNGLTWVGRRVARRRNPARVEPPTPVDTIRPDDPGWAEVDSLLDARKRIQAIAAARRRWGLNFGDAKRLIEQRSQ